MCSEGKILSINFLPDPLFLLYLARHSLAIDRPRKLNPKKMERYQVKTLRKMIQYAYRVPLYQDKYKKSKVYTGNIHRINDVHKLPFVTKKDLRLYGEKGTAAKAFNRKNVYKVNTSGSTGEPVFIYRDLNTLVVEYTIFLRMVRAYNLSPFKTRITNIGDFSLPFVRHSSS
jgi:phenylacetate-coenzyme A ligase PaaK-like adenylate-forming protein